MKDIYVVFQRTNTFLAKAIRWFTRSDVNHVAFLYYSDEWEDWMVFEADTRGVILSPAGKRKWFYKFKVNNDITNELRVSKKYLTEFYNFGGLLLFGILIPLKRLFKFNIRRANFDTKGILCSELFARTFKEFELGNPQFVTPDDCKKICIFREDMFTLEKDR